MPSRRRHTFSVSRRFYDRLAAYCAAHDLPVAQLVSDVVNAAMDVPYVAQPPAPIERPRVPGRDGRPTHRYSYDSHPARCRECGVFYAWIRSQHRWSADGVTWSTLRPSCVPGTIVEPQPLAPRAAVYTCSQCGERGHNAASHGERYEIDVSPELYELISDLRVRQRELYGRDVTRGEILEAGIVAVLG